MAVVHIAWPLPPLAHAFGKYFSKTYTSSLVLFPTHPSPQHTLPIAGLTLRQRQGRNGLKQPISLALRETGLAYVMAPAAAVFLLILSGWVQSHPYFHPSSLGSLPGAPGG